MGSDADLAEVSAELRAELRVILTQLEHLSDFCTRNGLAHVSPGMACLDDAYDCASAINTAMHCVETSLDDALRHHYPQPPAATPSTTTAAAAAQEADAAEQTAQDIEPLLGEAVRRIPGRKRARQEAAQQQPQEQEASSKDHVWL